MEKVTHEQAYQQMRTILNEKQWRQYLAVEAKERGSVSQVAGEAGVSLNTVKRGLKELEAGELYRPGERVRKVGGGMKKLVETDATLLADLARHQRRRRVRALPRAPARAPRTGFAAAEPRRVLPRRAATQVERREALLLSRDV